MARAPVLTIQRTLQILQLIALIVAILYFGAPILMPIAMAVLFTFLLSPMVRALERRKVPRIVAVITVMAVIFTWLGIGAYLLTAQLVEIADRMPEFKQNLIEKARYVKSLTTGGELQSTVTELSNEIQEKATEIPTVRIAADAELPFGLNGAFVNAIFSPLANAGVVFVLVIFMLMGREDLRNRMVRLAGRRLTLTTRTLDDVGTRVSDYLMMNLLVNGGFGICVTLGLWIIGVEYALMWGVLAAVLRFIPYVGPIVASALPVAMAVIQEPGWTMPVAVIALFIVLELFTNNVIEPLAYGHSTGVSTVALLISAVFWTWVWGPVGLVLSVPLTVLLTVLGEHIRPLEPLAILLGDKQALAHHITYYQRLLAGDADEAVSIVEEIHSKMPLVEVFDTVIAPALILAERDREEGELAQADHESIWQTTRDLIDELAAADATVTSGTLEVLKGPPQASLQAYIIGCPAHDTSDELALTMLAHTLPLSASGKLETLPASMLVSEVIAQIERKQPDGVCVSSLGPVGVEQTRYLCKRLRQKFPQLRIIVGRWGYAADREKMVAGLKQRGADQVAVSLAEAHDLLMRVTRVTTTPVVPHTGRIDGPATDGANVLTRLPVARP